MRRGKDRKVIEEGGGLIEGVRRGDVGRGHGWIEGAG